MPTYTFKNKDNDDVFDIILKMSELDNFKEANPNYERIINGIGIICGTSIDFDGKIDGGWKENLQRIAEAHPNTTLGERYNRRTAKEVATANVVKKYKEKLLTRK